MAWLDGFNKLLGNVGQAAKGVVDKAAPVAVEAAKGLLTAPGAAAAGAAQAIRPAGANNGLRGLETLLPGALGAAGGAITNQDRFGNPIHAAGQPQGQPQEDSGYVLTPQGPMPLSSVAAGGDWQNFPGPGPSPQEQTAVGAINRGTGFNPGQLPSYPQASDQDIINRINRATGFNQLLGR